MRCGECIYFKVNADLNGIESTCKRLDHKKLRFAVPWFKTYDCGQFNGCVCRDFEPAKWCKYLYENWSSFDDYFREILDRKTVDLVIDGNLSIRYQIRYIDFVNNTFLDKEGNLKWIKRYFYKRVKVSEENPTGYKLVYEKNPDYFGKL